MSRCRLTLTLTLTLALTLTVTLTRNPSPNPNQVHASDLSPAAWPHEPSLEWAAAGDGALYAALHDSGVLDSLLRQNYRYMVS